MEPAFVHFESVYQGLAANSSEVAGKLYLKTIQYAVCRHQSFHSRHTANESAGILILDECEANADMAAIASRAGQVFGNLVEAHVPVGDF
jgi:hypothetical protein